MAKPISGIIRASMACPQASFRLFEMTLKIIPNLEPIMAIAA